MKDFFSSIFGFVIMFYILGTQLMTVVFFIDYCRVDSIAEIIFIDSWLSEIKGLLWIFFV